MKTEKTKLSFEDLLAAATKAESVELRVFKAAITKTLKAYQESPTKANQQNYEAAREAYAEKKQALEEKYFRGPAGQAFPSLLDACEHLKKVGYRISKSKIYRDRDKNFFKVNPDGSVPEAELRAYAAEHLPKSRASLNDLDDIHAVKTAREVERLEKQNEKLQFEMDRERGKYLPRRDFEAELAARAVILETSLKHLFNTRVGEWIALVGGHPNKSPDLLQVLHNSLEEELSNYASTQTFQVIFTEE
ncbi:hypothetical protein [Desulfotignum phosphitoxidans]|uniref:Uncharacterized protein n=1 Tax=Desulfotignum phosphitoxidans DSM 13687 TaxID=1286635 RepID=S0FWW3_9BACT|nr:hypothetical protein [Desulfotignum phosphitoxidans]EMS79185.1 hypothetical protein Dpo_5c01080 [Desulfotignum phosphitoxidans DSM 13687]